MFNSPLAWRSFYAVVAVALAAFACQGIFIAKKAAALTQIAKQEVLDIQSIHLGPG